MIICYYCYYYNHPIHHVIHILYLIFLTFFSEGNWIPFYFILFFFSNFWIDRWLVLKISQSSLFLSVSRFFRGWEWCIHSFQQFYGEYCEPTEQKKYATNETQQEYTAKWNDNDIVNILKNEIIYFSFGLCGSINDFYAFKLHLVVPSFVSSVRQSCLLWLNLISTFQKKKKKQPKDILPPNVRNDALRKCCWLCSKRHY